MKKFNCISEVSTRWGRSGDRSSVYLTFDDGPNPHCTPGILDVLAEYGVPATFCVIGAYAAREPLLIRRMISDGHEVANHTMTHPDFSICDPNTVEQEILQANRAIRMACPQCTLRHVRAPYGKWTTEVISIASRAGLAALHWSVDPRDWSRPGVNAIIDSVLNSVRPGAIVLLHDGSPPGDAAPCTHVGPREQTVIALSRLIPELHNHGFKICLLP
ncbi:chitooligosaccharide deacetylase NodB [Methylobacterium sp. WSM2598]|uniref:chitooligosaccharide deacetylase NodB n=1 Tax=Methylobacterium sp. WSM2598 TaxID=398261 RepID=UPI0003AB173B|nr:chitooligosaccharide deacetylase NodB [Methylobacterium sp. WSM2598]